MKTITKYFILYISVISLIAVHSCDLEETNVNPNLPTDVPEKVLLPPAQLGMARVLAENTAVISGIFIQYFKGNQSSTAGFQNYVIDPAFTVNPIWEDFYTVPLLGFNQVINKAEKSNSPHYSGLAKICMAATLGTATTVWGDVPYTEAFQGSANLSPVYNSQENIYSIIQQLLDEAILECQSEESVFSPGSDDVIFNGDMDHWIKIAYGLKARYYLHTLKRDAVAADAILDAINKSIGSTNEDMDYYFGPDNGRNAPWHEYFKNTPYIEINTTFIDLMDLLDDPRKSYLLELNFGRYKVGPYYASTTSPVPILTYYELKFIEAEAQLSKGLVSEAEMALKEGIKANIHKISDGAVSGTELDSIANIYGSLNGSPEENMEVLMTQKYVALFTQIEAWSDFRRTGFPVLVPNEGGNNPQNPGGDIPRRIPYSQNEMLYNTNIPRPIPTMQDRMWIDLE